MVFTDPPETKSYFDIGVNRGSVQKRSACVYRYYSANYELLYVGVTVNLKRRMQGHRCYSPWIGKADHVTEQWFDDAGDAYAEEKRAIRDEHPRENIQGQRKLPEAA